MARDVTSGFKTAAEAALCRPVVFAEIDTISASKRRPTSVSSSAGWGVASNINAMIDGDPDTYAQLVRTHFGLSDSGSMSAFTFPGLPFTLDDGDITVSVTLETTSDGSPERRAVVFSENSDGSGVSAAPDGYDSDVDTPKTTFSHTFPAGTCPATLYMLCEIVSIFLGEHTNTLRIYDVTIQKGSGDVYVWNGRGNKSWNGHTWQGLGKFGGLSPISESLDMTASGIKLTLSGIPSDLVSLVLGDLDQKCEATVWFGFLEDDNSVIADPCVAFMGLVDVPEIEDTGSTSTITISVESDAIVHHRPQGTRYTDQDQKRLFPTDRGFEFVDVIQNTNISLGAAGRMPISSPQYDE